MSANAITSPTPILKLGTEKKLTQVTVRCSGSFVSDACEQLQGTVQGFIPTTKLLVLDLTNVNIDSSALGTIVGLYLSSKCAGCRLKVINLSPPMKELLRMWPEGAFEQID